MPIFQGGMAIRLSTAALAGAVAREGGVGLVAISGMEEAEVRAELRLARKLSEGHGAIGINCMFAARAFKKLITIAAEEKVDLLVAGAGFSRDIFGVGREYGVEVVPIVSSVKLAKIAEKLGASAIVIEGTEAVCGSDIVDLLRLGASGVQMGSRFAASVESNGAPFLKEMYLKMTQEDVVQIDSPVGYKGRSIRSPFAQLSLEGKSPRPTTCDACLKHCGRNFCIIRALSRAQQGDVETGLIFTGANMWKIKEILPVKEIFRRIREEVAQLEPLDAVAGAGV